MCNIYNIYGLECGMTSKKYTYVTLIDGYLCMCFINLTFVCNKGIDVIFPIIL